MSPISFLRKLFAFTLFLAAATSASACSQSLPSPSNNGGSFTGGMQLLIPSWTFFCQGVIDDWFAHVTGNTSVGSGIEFQVLKPDPVKSIVYSLVYGNTYGDGGESFNGSRIEINALNTGSQILLPVRPGYIVGVYIDSNAVNQLNLIYEDTAEDIDIYYWENLTGRMCDLSLCDAKVMRGVRPLIGWIFRNITDNNVLSNQETIVQFVRNSNTQYCNGSISAITNCSLLPSTSSAEITMSSLHTSITSSQSLLYTSSSTSKEYFHTTTNSIEGKTSSSLIPSHSTSPTIQASSPIIQASSTATTVSSTANTISPTALSNGGTSTQFFFILGVSVAALLIIIIVLLLVLIFLFGYKCIKRCGSERLANKTIVDSARNTTGQNPHISTGVNPSYHQHSIITAAGPTCNTGRKEGSQMKEGQQNYELVDSNKYDDIHVYFQPDPPHAIKAKLHTYGNVANNNSKWNEYGPIYEDTDTL